MTPPVKHTVKKAGAGLALLSVDIIILVVVFSIALFGFIILAENVFRNHKFEFDQDAFEFVAANVSNVHTNIMRFFSFMGSPTFLVSANILLIIYFLFINKHRWYSINVLKLGFHRDRPITPLLKAAAGYSFPSGHALMSMTFYGLMVYLVWVNSKRKRKKWIISILLALLVLCIGISRIYLRVHYASDVIGGYCMGLVWLITSLSIVRRMERFSLRKVDPIVQTENLHPK